MQPIGIMVVGCVVALVGVLGALIQRRIKEQHKEQGTPVSVDWETPNDWLFLIKVGCLISVAGGVWYVVDLIIWVVGLILR